MFKKIAKEKINKNKNIVNNVVILLQLVYDLVKKAQPLSAVIMKGSVV
ncbi:hypothetical protein ACTQ54_00265 [Fundicoccus sp. Sow4_H7]